MLSGVFCFVLVIYFVCVYVCGHMHATVHVWRSEFSLQESLPSSYLWDPALEFVLLGLAVSAFIHRAILPAHLLY